MNSRYSFSGVGYRYGNFGIFNSYMGKFVLLVLVALIVFGLFMLVKALRNKK